MSRVRIFIFTSAALAAWVALSSWVAGRIF